MRPSADTDSPARGRALLLCALAIGCGPSVPAATDGAENTTGVDSSGSGTDPTTTTSTVGDTTIATTLASDTDVTPNAGCECTRPGQPELYSYDHETCGWGPCGTIELGCLDGSLFDGTWCEPDPPLLDVEAVDCTLELLTTGTPGTVHYRQTFDFGFSGEGGYLRIVEGRVGLSRTWMWADLGGSSSELAVVALRDAPYFESCKAMLDPFARYQCLRDWSQGPSLEACDEPINYQPN